ncbi:hypothetical protein pb186bvf_012208 [Paramecium bursaria]
MKNFQEMIIRINEQVQNVTLQKGVIPFQFIIISSSIFLCLNNLDSEEQPLKMEFLGKLNLPDIAQILEINQYWIQGGILFSQILLIVLMIIDFFNLGESTKYIKILWDSYLITYWIIMQNCAYGLYQDQDITSLSIINLILTTGITIFICFYSIKLAQTQILIRLNQDRFNIIILGGIAFINGLAFNIPQVNKHIYFIILFIYDLYQGVKYLIYPTCEYYHPTINKQSKYASLLRVPIIVIVWSSTGAYQQTSLCVTRITLLLPFYICIINNFWHKAMKKFLLEYEHKFQLMVYQKGFYQSDLQIESYIQFFLHLPQIKTPLNNMIILNLLCNHQMECGDTKCFCVDMKFHINPHQEFEKEVDTIDKMEIQTNEQITQRAYYKLVLMFIDNQLKRIKNREILDRIVDEVNLQEMFRFQNRLFWSKIRLNQFSNVGLPFFPDIIRRMAIAKLTTDALTIHVGQPPLSYIDVAVFIKYNKILEIVTDQTPRITKEKIIILELLRQNYQSPTLYLLQLLASKYVLKLNKYEQNLKQLFSINGESQIVKELYKFFTSFIKNDYRKHKEQPPKSPIAIINTRNTAYIIAKYFNKFTIEEHSKSLINIVPIDKPIVGIEVASLIPGTIQKFHFRFLQNLITTSKGHLLDQNLVDLFVGIGDYVKEIKALIRIDPTNHNSLRLIAFIQDLEREDPFFIADDEGRIEGYSKQAAQKLGLDQINITNLNMTFLSPDLIDQETKHFDGFLLIPFIHHLHKYKTHFKHFLQNPNDCDVYYVSAQYVFCDFSIVKIQTLRLNACYKLKVSDYKLVALDIMFRQALLNQNIKSDTYKTTLTSLQRIQTFRKEQKPISYEDNDISRYQLDDMEVRASDRNIQFNQTKSPTPDLLQSLIQSETNRFVQDKLLQQSQSISGTYDQINQTTHFKQVNISMQDIYDDGIHPYDVIKEKEQEQDEILEPEKCIYLSAKDLDNKNLKEQINIIYIELKKWEKHHEVERLIHGKTKKVIFDDQQSVIGEDKQTQNKMIQQLVINATKEDHILVRIIKLIVFVFLIINLIFFIIFMTVILDDFTRVSQNTLNTSYPITIYNDLNYIIIGIHIQNLNPDLIGVGKNYVDLAIWEYANRSIQINNYESSDFYFLQQMDSFQTRIKYTEYQIQQVYNFDMRYLLFNYLINNFQQIENKQSNKIDGFEEQIIQTNYQDLVRYCKQARQFTLADVNNNRTQMEQNLTLQLVFAILTNSCALAIMIYYIHLNLEWRKLIVTSYFLFPNLTPYIQLLQETAPDYRLEEYPNKVRKEHNLNKDNNIRRFEMFKISIVVFLLSGLSIGFYIPMVSNVQQSENLMISYTQLYNQVEQATLRFSQQFAIFVMQLNGLKEDQQYYNTSDTVLTDTIDELYQAQQNIFFNVPYDSSYSGFPKVQNFAHEIVSQSIYYGIQNGYSSFQVAAQQHISLTTGEIINSTISTDLTNLTTYLKSQSFTQLVQAYNDVVSFNIKSKTEITQFLQDKRHSTISTFQTLAIILQIFIVITQSLFMVYVSKVIKNIHYISKELIFCFNTSIIATNKHVQQALARESVIDNKK